MPLRSLPSLNTALAVRIQGKNNVGQTKQIENTSVNCLTTYTICIKITKKGADTMATSPTQIRIDSNVKTEANELFKELGIDMSSAVNIFLRQCVLHGGLPFKVEIPKYHVKFTQNPTTPQMSCSKT